MAPLRFDPLAWRDAPRQVFAELSHLEGLVFLDSAADKSGEISIIAAEPEEVLAGSIYEDRHLSALSLGIEKYREKKESAGEGYPAGGWFGTVSYEGNFHFGLYRNLLIYEHASERWLEVGGRKLSEKRKATSPDPRAVFGEWSANFTQDAFEKAVQKAQDYIAAGDIYQVNLTQKFSAQTSGKLGWPLYQQLRSVSPVPMGAYFERGNCEVLSTSPELFMKFRGRELETRPIKGTRPRGRTALHDAEMRAELLASKKERAELLMITDLLRNDLGQVCEFGSVKVPSLTQLEIFAQVHHLVSTVRGRLRQEVSQLEALVACLPGGSITGAPKRRAREIITELEPEKRGLYTGVAGYFGLNGVSQFSILIRTLLREGDIAHYSVGAGIVADSVPAEEYAETLHKAAGLRTVLGGR